MEQRFLLDWIDMHRTRIPVSDSIKLPILDHMGAAEAILSFLQYAVVRTDLALYTSCHLNGIGRFAGKFSQVCNRLSGSLSSLVNHPFRQCPGSIDPCGSNPKPKYTVAQKIPFRY